MSGNKIRILVFPCGSENALEIHQALRYSVHVELFGASSVEDCGRYVFERYYGELPNIKEKSFDEVFQRLIRDLGIEVVFATHDTVHEYLSSRASQMGFFLVNGDEEAAAIARRKSATYRMFSDCCWVPRVFGALKDADSWPVVVKPDFGQGGQNIVLAHGPDEARMAMEGMSEPVVVEHLPGMEITVDCFTDRNRKLVWIGPRTRDRVRAGITMRSRFLDPDPEIDAIAQKINERLKLRGPWFFQLKKDGRNAWKLLEISCRVAGSMVSQRARGINLPLMAVQDYLGRSLIVLSEPRIRMIERHIKTRAVLEFQYDTVYVDLDDTLVVNGYASPIMVAFLYQSVNEGKKVVLITRHEANVEETLRNAKIPKTIFNEIIHLRNGESKAEHVRPASIFIDNHFPERHAVFVRQNIPVFDADAVEFFIK
ncbi:MAG: ATP-grasp domain-containing protein [Kiritimatiellia bacterium]